MAPRQSTAHRRSMAQSETFHDLGVRGRKTGVTLKDTGVRDEHGMQPLDDIFSSPDRESQAGAGAANGNNTSEDDSGDEASMDIDEVTAPAPSAFMNGRPPARARSPVKTALGSSPRRARGMSSSPVRGPGFATGSPAGTKSVQRKLDFKKNPLLASKPDLPKPNGVNGNGNGKAIATSHDDYRSSPSDLGEGFGYPDVDPVTEPEESLAMLNVAGADDKVDESGDHVESEAPPSAKRGRGRPKKSAPSKKPEGEVLLQSIEGGDTADEEPVRTGKKRCRTAKDTANEEADAQPAKKKAKGSSSHAEDDDDDEEPQKQAPKARGRKPKAAATTEAEAEAETVFKKPAIPKQKRAAKRASPTVGDNSVAEVPRGPPLPKSRGLVITRREAPGSGADMFTTRSGRTSYRPLQYWRNERTEMDNDDVFQDGKTAIVLPHIKNIIRYNEEEPEQRGGKSRRKGRSGATKKGGKRRGRAYIDDDGEDDELEPWEADGDVITGETAVWQPEHEVNPPGPDEEIEVADEQIAVSANAIQTREIRNATFKFAKTASMPFFGTGVVDLPPHSEKKPKNSRKMYMAFSVLTGRVTVTVADTVFSIGRGGQFFVPRGNYYSMENVLDKPARLFFSQGCEVPAGQAGDTSQLNPGGM
ncbi:kinetochore CENP-C fungal-like protein [Coniella lustricola]|uniref:CENP-C homolog n=1 Tax=Coniella lustricola TaxID=2025994 RepID=A0A2T3A945_9PEZI|nr:kinetochore CENP-C fungal-like protein [Coniella lustricola]